MLRLVCLLVIINLSLSHSLYSEETNQVINANTQLNEFNHNTQPLETGHFYKTVQLGILDKVTGRVLQKSLTLDKPIQFGTLIIEVKRCWHDRSAMYPETKAFLIIQNKSFDDKLSTVFKGWMFASTPSISTLEHPVYDVWVIDVDQTSRTVEKISPTSPNDEEIFKDRKSDNNNHQLDKILKSIYS